MIKLKLVIICLVVSFSVLGQKKDSVIRVADTINTISVKDVNNLLKVAYGKIGQDDYEKLKIYLELLLQMTEPKRKIINH